MTAPNPDSERSWNRSWVTLLLLLAFLVAIGSPGWMPWRTTQSESKAGAGQDPQPRYAARGAGDGARVARP